jgi:phosphonate degradation associated HDIG domain protein
MDFVETIFDLFRRSGDTAYFGEPVTQSEHALQTAWLASRDQTAPALILAALLHDVGHLLHQRGEDAADRGIDTRHEIIGSKWLSRWLGPEVTEPIRLHVPAKRYLCHVDPSYPPQLSAGSQQSLNLQGGAFSAAEASELEQQQYWKAAVQLRRWDEEAKVPGLTVPDLAHYRSLLSTGGR